MDTGADAWWVQHNAPDILAKRGYRASTVQAARRFYNGQLKPDEVLKTIWKFAGAYFYRVSPLALLSAFRIKRRPEAHVFAFSRLLTEWTVMNRLPEIDVPTLVCAGRHDFLFPPEHQAILADRLPHAQLEIVECAGHNAHDEQTGAVLTIMKRFLATAGLRRPLVVRAGVH
jgi:proline iminopeptidase